MRWVVALVVAMLAWAPAAGAAADPPDPGQATPGTVTADGAEYRYLVYTPASYDPGRAAPLLVMVHGCQTTAEEQMRASLFNPVAEREGFVVLYPDVDALGRAQPGPARQCWKFPYPPAWTRDRSDAAAIAEMTRAVMAARNVDAERVYLVGISAGGLMASTMAAAYPDLYAAVGVVASSAYADGPCFATGVGIPVELSAQLALAQMGRRGRVVPRFVIGGDADLAFPATCVDKALQQGLRTTNLVLGGSQERPVSLAPAATREEPRQGGYASTVSTYRDPDGCLIGERWIVRGMGHFWPGGTTDPEYKNFTDPKGPNGAEVSWAFLRRFTRGETAMPCAEAPAPSPAAPAAAPRRCRAGWLRVRLPAGARAITATANGRRAAVRRTRSGVRVRLPSGPRARTHVVLKARTRAGRSLTRRHAVRGCGI